MYILMANYKTAIQQTLKWEGGYVNNPNDRGGETYRGIARKFHPLWSGWVTVDNSKPLKKGAIIKSLEDDVIEFYKAHYWDKIRLDEVCNDKVAGFVFDWYVNSGTSGIKSIQRAIGVEDDGKVGKDTLHALNQTTLEHLRISRENFVRSIVRSNPSQKVFLNGWLNRIKSFS